MLPGRPLMYVPDLPPDVVGTIASIMHSNVCETLKERCRILLSLSKNSPELSRKTISLANCHPKDFASRIAKLFVEVGVSCLQGLARSPKSDIARLKLDARAEGFLISLACTPPPTPYSRWTVKLLTKELNVRMEQNGLPGGFSTTTVWRALDRNELHPHLSEYWCIPEVTPEFILRMENVLNLYSLPYDSSFPVVCMDEAAIHVIQDLKPRLEMIPGESEKLDYEYIRNGSKNIFIFIEPKTGQYYIKVTDNHTAIDWAYAVRHMVNTIYSEAKKIILVSDNLSTHNIESLYKAFPAEEARQIAERIQFVHTPLHASWLNMAEIGINVMKRECIGKRFRTESDVESFPASLAQWQNIKNAEAKPISWQFSVYKARDNHPNLYKIDHVETSLVNYDQFNSQVMQSRVSINEESVNISIYNRDDCDDENIIDLCRAVDSDGNEYRTLSLEDNRVAFREPVGKKQIVAITGQNNTFDGWSIPVPSKPRTSKEGKTPRPITYDYDFMAHGEDVTAVYNEPYDPMHPVVCICKRPFDLENNSQNTWIANLRPEPKPKKDLNEKSQDVVEEIQPNNRIEDTRLGITIMYEPHTGRKWFQLSDWSDDLSWAQSIHNLVENIYSEAKSIKLIICKDDANKIATTEQLFTADEALRLVLKLDIHTVPEKARWLNFAENEMITVCRQCMRDNVSSAAQVTNHFISWQKINSVVDFKLTLKKFRKAFSNVYKPSTMFST